MIAPKRTPSPIQGQTKRVKTDHIDNLRKLNDYNTGYQYIIDNKLEDWLKNEVKTDDEEKKTTDELWTAYFETNIYKPDVTLKSTQMLPMSGGSIKLKQHGRNKTRKGGSIAHSIQPQIFFKEHFNTLTVLNLRDENRNLVCRVYGSSLPFGDNAQELYEYFYNSVGIKTMISLQACGTTKDVVHSNSCEKMKWSQKDGSKTEKEIWGNSSKKIRGFRNHKRKHKPKFIDIEWKDMTAPSLSVFDYLNSTPIWISPTLIHCYAGLGRTGATLFFFWFRWTILNKMFEVFDLNSNTEVQIGYQALLHPFLKCAIPPTAVGSTRSSEMYFRLLQQFENCLSIGHLDTKFKVGSTYTIERMGDELFKIKTLTSANLFVARINYVLLYIALFLNEQVDYSKYPGLPPPGGKITRIYLYKLHNNYPLRKNEFDEHTIFQSPTPTDIHTYVVNNNFGFKPVNIPYTGVTSPALASSASSDFFGSALSTP
jgi:hypothetical protein